MQMISTKMFACGYFCGLILGVMKKVNEKDKRKEAKVRMLTCIECGSRYALDDALDRGWDIKGRYHVLCDLCDEDAGKHEENTEDW